MGLFTASTGRWSYCLEGVYVKLSDMGSKSVTGPFGGVTVDGALNVTSSMTIYQGSVSYRVLDEITSVDLVGALRYLKLETDASVAITTTAAIGLLDWDYENEGTRWDMTASGPYLRFGIQF